MQTKRGRLGKDFNACLSTFIADGDLKKKKSTERLLNNLTYSKTLSI